MTLLDLLRVRRDNLRSDSPTAAANLDRAIRLLESQEDPDRLDALSIIDLMTGMAIDIDRRTDALGEVT